MSCFIRLVLVTIFNIYDEMFSFKLFVILYNMVLLTPTITKQKIRYLYELYQFLMPKTNLFHRFLLVGSGLQSVK